MNFQFRGQRVPLALVAIALVLLVVGGYVISKHRWAESTLASVEPRYARLAGLEGTQAQLEASLAERRALVQRHAYAASFDAGRAGSDAQQRARDLFAKAGLEVASTQVLPAKTVDGYDRIPIVLRVEGDFSALHSALVVLHSQAPTLFIDGFQSQSVMPVRPDAQVRVSVQLNLFVLRART